MRDFLTEYGFAILAAIVVILLIGFASPLGDLVKNKLTGTVNQMGDASGNLIANKLNNLEK